MKTRPTKTGEKFMIVGVPDQIIYTVDYFWTESNPHFHYKNLNSIKGAEVRVINKEFGGMTVWERTSFVNS